MADARGCADSHSGSDKINSVSNADSEQECKESNKRRRSSQSSSVSLGHKRLCSINEITPRSSEQDEDASSQRSYGTNVIPAESKNSVTIPKIKMSSLDLPLKLSEWKRKHIENLYISIVYDPYTKPMDLIQCGEIKNYQETEKIRELKKYMQKSPIMGNLRSLDHLYTSFSELSSESLWEMAPNDDEKISMIPAWVPEEHMTWFYRFHCQAQEFGNQLYLVLKRREHGCDIHESHVQALFEAFASMFGLKSGLSSAPCLEMDTRKIMTQDISGAADIIFPCTMFSPFQQVEQGTQHPPVVAVCGIEKECPEVNDTESPLSSKNQTKSKIRSTDSSEGISSTTDSGAAQRKTVQHLDDKTIGQHGGQLLFYYPDTIKKGKILGLIVQETQVTFTMLEISAEQYNDIVEGSVKQGSGNRPTLKVTKPYDYMKSQDREYIIEAFIKLAMLQRKIF